MGTYMGHQIHDESSKDILMFYSRREDGNFDVYIYFFTMYIWHVAKEEMAER